MNNSARPAATPLLPEILNFAGRAGVPGEPPMTTAKYDAEEERYYGGFSAALLAPLAVLLLRFRAVFDVGPFIRVFGKLSDRMGHALYIYTQVKAALRGLNTEIVLQTGPLAPRRKARRPAETANVPGNWTREIAERGYDPRGTSHIWVSHRCKALRARARQKARADQGLVRKVSYTAPPHDIQDQTHCPSVQKTTDTAVLGEIWPPISLPDRITPKIRIAPMPPAKPKDTGSRYSPILGYAEIYHLHLRERASAGELTTPHPPFENQKVRAQP